MRIFPLAAAALFFAAIGLSPVRGGGLPPVRIILVGDSTMALRTGYGTGFCQLVTAEVTCLNMAKGGRSSLSYRVEGSWAKVMETLQNRGDFKATYVLVQFGHNDQPNKPGRSTDVATEFPANLGRFVDEIRSAGAKPVLVTPLTRRMFRNGKVADTLGPWADAARTVAREKSVPLLDLNAESLAVVQKMGPMEANDLAQAPPPPAYTQAAMTGTSLELPKKVAAAPNGEPKGDPPPVFDYTHVGAKGAAFFGHMVSAELVNAVPDLRSYFKQ